MARPSQITRRLMVGLKLVATAASLLAIAAAFLVGSDEAQVEPAHADIHALGNFAPETKKERFGAALSDLGMSTPRAYDWNGNTVYFSYMLTPDEPHVVLERFQRAFVERGLNSKMYHDVPDYGMDAEDVDPKRPETTLEYAFAFGGARDFFNGGLVPTEIAPERIVMTGMDPRNSYENIIELARDFHIHERELDDMVGALRTVEILREGGQDNTTVTATWTDDDFQLGRFMPNASSSSPAQDLPTCLGCKHLMRFAGTAAERPYIANLYISPYHASSDLSAYYRRVLADHGWNPDPASVGVNVFLKSEPAFALDDDAEVISYIRGKEYLTLAIFRSANDGKTYVQAMNSP